MAMIATRLWELVVVGTILGDTFLPSTRTVMSTTCVQRIDLLKALDTIVELVGATFMVFPEDHISMSFNATSRIDTNFNCETYVWRVSHSGVASGFEPSR